ncbi:MULTISPECIES: RHS repeat-associated core domain-containing protein, partial [Butyricimonas]|uniref:RHS repeat-associated core domain-containing protein n=1 Tax=Butyricimonas TaxID=574697 RepID=UPI0026F45C59
NVDAGSRWKYNGKEDQVTGGLGWLDYGARMYDWELGRWFGMDPKTENDISTSGYVYCKGNPVLFIDPDGQMIDWYRSWDKSAYIWKDSQSPYLKIGGETYFNVGSTFSMSYGNEYYNYFQNALVSTSNVALDARVTIFNNDFLLGGLLSNRSPLSRKYQQILFNTSIHNAQKDFLEHPVTQVTINSLLFVATGGIEGIAAIGGLGKNILNKVVCQCTTSDGFLFGGITMKTPFNIPVQRFGQMRTLTPDFWGMRIGPNSFANRTFAAIKPEWNNLTQYTTGIIPKGTSVRWGIIGPQGLKYPGGSLQFILDSRNVINQTSKLITR